MKPKKSVSSLIFRHYFSYVLAVPAIVIFVLALPAAMAEKYSLTFAFVLISLSIQALADQLRETADEGLRLWTRVLLGLPFVSPEISRNGVWERVLFLYGAIPHRELDNDRSPAVRRAEDAERVARFFNLLPVYAQFGVF